MFSWKFIIVVKGLKTHKTKKFKNKTKFKSEKLGLKSDLEKKFSNYALCFTFKILGERETCSEV